MYAVLCTVLSLCGIEPSSAQTARTYAGEFLQLGVGARSLALGNSGAAISEDATAGYWNPAGLNLLRYPMVTAMHESRFNGTVQYDYGALAIPIDSRTSAALSVLHLGITEIKDTRNALVDLNHNGLFDQDEYLDYNKVSSFGNYDWIGILSFGGMVDSNWSYGVNAKIVARKLDPENSATGIGLDASVRYRDDRWMLGAIAQDVTTTLLSYTSGTKELVTPTLKLGAAYLISLTDDNKHRILPVVDLDLRFDNRRSISEIHAGPVSADAHLGLEYQWGSVFALRGGYSDLKMWSVGAGVALGRLRVDYAFLGFNAQDQLGNTHRISLAFSLEQPKWKRS